MPGGATPGWEGKQAFELSLEMADCHLEERGIPSEGPETSPGLWFVGVLRKDWLFQSGQTTGGTGDEAGEVDKSQSVGSH